MFKQKGTLSDPNTKHQKPKYVLYGFFFIAATVMVIITHTRTLDNAMNMELLNENTVLEMQIGQNSKDDSYPVKTGTYEDVLDMIDLLNDYTYRPRVWQKFFGNEILKLPHIRIRFVDSESGKVIYYILIQGVTDVVIYEKNEGGMDHGRRYYMRRHKFNLADFEAFYNALPKE